METHRRGLVLLFIMFTLAAFAESPFKFVLLTSTTRFDDAATGTADEQRTSYQYDDHGRVVFRAAEWDFNGDGALDYRSTSSVTYSPMGQRVQAVNESYDLTTGTLQGRDIVTDEYDSRGNRIRSLSEADSNGDGTINFIAMTVLQYDAQDKLIGWVTYSDHTADGTWEDVEKVTRAYDNSGNLVLSVRETDSSGDGVIDLRRTSRFTYDAHGDRITAQNELDYAADGVIELIERTVYAYDRKGTLLSSTGETEFYPEDGDVERSNSSVTYFYDPHGNLIRIVEQDDAYADDTIDGTRTTTQTWDRIRIGHTP
jgi:hypothetical protein